MCSLHVTHFKYVRDYSEEVHVRYGVTVFTQNAAATSHDDDITGIAKKNTFYRKQQSSSRITNT